MKGLKKRAARIEQKMECVELDIYSEFKEWQTGIGALFGFIALMFAALWNFRLNRLRDVALRRDEMLSVSAALYGEILLLQGEMARVIRIVTEANMRGGKYGKSFAEDYGPPEPTLYPALGHKLGLLPADLVIAITSFHASYEKAKKSLQLISRMDEIRFHVLTFLEPAVESIDGIAPALRKIENLADLPEAKQPDVGHGPDVIKRERDMLDAQERL